MAIVKAVISAAIYFVMLVTFTSLIVMAQTAPEAAKAAPAQPASQPTGTELEELKKEVRELKAGQEQIREEVRELKRMLLARETPPKPAPPEKININERPSRGSETARIVVVEFSDYQCPYCGRFFRETLPQLDEAYIKTGKVRYVFNNVPLDQLHPAAFRAAEAAECAGHQGKFWEMHDRIFTHQKALSAADLAANARAIGLDTAKFNQCLETGKNTDVIKDNLVLAEKIGVDGTPTFVIGLADATNLANPNVKVLSIIPGALPFTVFKSVIDKALATR